MILLDTDHVSILANRHATHHAALVRRLNDASEPVVIPIIGAEEQCRGWLAKISRTSDVHQQISAYARLESLFDFLAEWDIAPFGTAAADRFKELRRRKVRIGSQDLKIAAIALTHDALLLSANQRDFSKSPACAWRIGSHPDCRRQPHLAPPPASAKKSLPTSHSQ